MTSRAIATVGAVVLAVAFLCVAGVATLTGAASACSVITTPSGTTGRYDAEQLHHAQIIVTVGVQDGIPVRGQIIAVATALQESGLRNLGHLGENNDHDSLGLFQQRPSQGWGTPAQIMNPEYAAGAFYRKLVTIPGWQTMPLTVAAQAVQRSAYPDAYAKWEGDANVLVGLASGQPGGGTAGPGEQCISVGGWMKPVQGPLVSGFRTTERPGHDGVDIAAPKGTTIHAAASGLVIRVVCNAHLINGDPYSCDVDGDPVTVRGCGWYIELLHPDSSVTRYCHMVRRPSIDVGQQVAVGQIIGQVGSSGHSSGPHLHLETHTGQPATESNAVDPVGFFAVRGIDLSQPAGAVSGVYVGRGSRPSARE
ncbi:peptidase M23 [Micromonospora sp. S4605]|uniref:M23 family metallopeptidase n=1 Tax=Micromonospora sp. S4605 TaxID=1420897 RepID=UPI000D6EC2DD|nr:M23 family metallopeptidase [Micromonospora sp. S4605]PWU52450.1 peptidase M23 [Micromonospora sp. S4605]